MWIGHCHLSLEISRTVPLMYLQWGGNLWSVFWWCWKGGWMRILCSVSFLHFLLHHVRLPGPQPLRCRHHGQLRLPHQVLGDHVHLTVRSLSQRVVTCDHKLISYTFSLLYFFCRHMRLKWLNSNRDETRNKSYRDRLPAKICDIFHSMFYCVQVLYTTNQQTPVFRNI